jgi:hypothetical protein
MGWALSMAALILCIVIGLSHQWRQLIVLSFVPGQETVTKPMAYNAALAVFTLLNIPVVAIMSGALLLFKDMPPSARAAVAAVLSGVGSTIWWWLLARWWLRRPRGKHA